MCGAWRFMEHSEEPGRSGQENQEAEVCPGSEDTGLLGMETLRAGHSLAYWVPRVSSPLLFPATLRETQLPLTFRKSLTLPLIFCVILGMSPALSFSPLQWVWRAGGLGDPKNPTGLWFWSLLSL